MRFHKFYTPTGALDCIINLDMVLDATPTELGKVILNSGQRTYTVDKKQFEEAIADRDDRMSEVRTLVTRLIQAMDRMIVHFPTSIRMHM